MTNATVAAEMEDAAVGEGTAVLLSVVVVIVTFLYLTHCQAVATHTWTVMGATVSLVIAIMWFDAFDALMSLAGMEGSNEIICSLLHCAFWLGMLNVVSYHARLEAASLATWSMLFAHVATFSLVHFYGTLQEEMGDAWYFIVGTAVLGFVALALKFAIISQGRAHVASDPDETHHAWFDKMVAMENTMGCAVVAFLWTQAVRYFINGKLPPLSGGSEHTSEATNIMLLYSLGVSAVAMCVSCLPGSSRIETLARLFMNMCAAWGLLLWAEWVIEKSSLGPLLGAVAIGMLMSALAVACILALGYAHKDAESSLVLLETELGVVVGMLLGKSWATIFKLVMTDVVTSESAQHPAIPKLLLSVGMALLLLPAFRLLIIPRSLGLDPAPLDECGGEDGDSDASDSDQEEGIPG